jgi:iron(III) transport system substrate-binding protein
LKRQKKVAVFWPNQADRGAHINISGAGITQAAKNKENAVKLMEYLTSDQAQQWYAETNGEYPIRDTIPMSATLAAWGNFKKDALAMSELGLLNAEATRIMDKAGWR